MNWGHWYVHFITLSTVVRAAISFVLYCATTFSFRFLDALADRPAKRTESTKKNQLLLKLMETINHPQILKTNWKMISRNIEKNKTKQRKYQIKSGKCRRTSVGANFPTFHQPKYSHWLKRRSITTDSQSRPGRVSYFLSGFIK